MSVAPTPSDIGTEAWVAKLDEALRALGPPDPPADVVIEYVVTVDTETTRCYHVVVTPDGSSAATGPPRRADVTLTQELHAAVRVASGELAPEEAFITGQLRLGGGPEPLLAAADTLASVNALLGRR